MKKKSKEAFRAMQANQLQTHIAGLEEKIATSQIAGHTKPVKNVRALKFMRQEIAVAKSIARDKQLEAKKKGTKGIEL